MANLLGRKGEGKVFKSLTSGEIRRAERKELARVSIRKVELVSGDGKEQ